MKFINKKLLIIIAVLAVVSAAAVLSWYFYFKKISAPVSQEIPSSISAKTEEEKLSQKQLEDLDKLRGETQPLTEEEIQKQLG